tara:strand:- start:12 stop:728 length:717 start_codon:yes stop_codon:yes gene_type:complete
MGSSTRPEDIHGKYLSPASVIDSDNDQIVAYTEDLLKNVDDDPVAKAVSLYYAVRDGIWYDPYRPFFLPEHYRASNVLKSGKAFCIGKASLLCAVGRVAGIPTRVGFADVRNHLATKQFIEFLGNDNFVYHAFVEFHLLDKWVRATPAFNVELCQKHDVAPLEFNGREDSLFHSYDMNNRKFMEYLEYHGTFVDIPVDNIVSAWENAYGKKRVGEWIRKWEESRDLGDRDFFTEEVTK